GWPPAVAWAVVVGVELEELEELDDPPHSVSSSTTEPSPAAAAHPLLRITTLHSRFSGSLGRPGVLPDATPFPIRRKRTRPPGPPTASYPLLSHPAAEPGERHRVT